MELVIFFNIAQEVQPLSALQTTTTKDGEEEVEQQHEIFVLPREADLNSRLVFAELKDGIRLPVLSEAVVPLSFLKSSRPGGGGEEDQGSETTLNTWVTIEKDGKLIQGWLKDLGRGSLTLRVGKHHEDELRVTNWDHISLQTRTRPGFRVPLIESGQVKADQLMVSFLRPGVTWSLKYRLYEKPDEVGFYNLIALASIRNDTVLNFRDYTITLAAGEVAHPPLLLQQPTRLSLDTRERASAARRPESMRMRSMAQPPMMAMIRNSEPPDLEEEEDIQDFDLPTPLEGDQSDSEEFPENPEEVSRFSLTSSVLAAQTWLEEKLFSVNLKGQMVYVVQLDRRGGQNASVIPSIRALTSATTPLLPEGPIEMFNSRLEYQGSTHLPLTAPGENIDLIIHPLHQFTRRLRVNVHYQEWLENLSSSSSRRTSLQSPAEEEEGGKTEKGKLESAVRREHFELIIENLTGKPQTLVVRLPLIREKVMEIVPPPETTRQGQWEWTIENVPPKKSLAELSLSFLIPLIKSKKHEIMRTSR